MQRWEIAEDCKAIFDFGDSVLKDISAELGGTDRTTEDLEAFAKPRDQVEVLLNASFAS